MSARPLISGHLYRIRTNGQQFDVIASSSSAAIVIALDLIGGE